MKDAKEILKSHQLRLTSCRTAVVEAFMSSNAALSHQDIEELIGNEYDRVTIYRTFTAFEEKGILHKVPDHTGQAKYALCEVDCTQHKHKDNHVHFKCQHCDNVYCLSEVELPKINLPQGYKIQEAEFLLSGTCNLCQ